jgi:hypothetical protein
MKMRKLLLFVCALAWGAGVSAQENTPQVRFGGTFFLTTYYDSYQSVDNREGVMYSYPKAPDLDALGRDRNAAGQFGMSVYSTRLHARAQGFSLLGAEAGAYVETDFLGSGEPGLQMIRMRHAYLDLRWKRDELLFGQTFNLLSPDETMAGVLTAGAAAPIAILSIPTMIRYGHSFSDRWKLYAAASYHRPQTGSVAAARNNGFPSAEARLQYNSERLFFGVAGSYQSLMPRLQTASGLKANERIASAQATAFLRYRSAAGAQLKLQAVYGTNLTRLGMPGGYGKAVFNKEHYDYTNFKGYSVWADYETRSRGGFRYGLFAGYYENPGTDEPVDPKTLFARDADLNLTGRLSPRFTYQKDNLLLGVEYSLFAARWGRQFNGRYQPVQSYDPTYNHRVTLLVRYAF